MPNGEKPPIPEVEKETEKEKELKELSELSGLTPDQVKDMKDLQEKFGFENRVTDYLIDVGVEEKDIESFPSEREAAEKAISYRALSQEEQDRIFERYSKYRETVRNKVLELEQEIGSVTSAVYGTVKSGHEEYVKKVGMEELNKRKKAFEALPEEKREEKHEAIYKLRELVGF